ncbi:MAG: acetylornithine deacetylase [Verrucomicrobiaceae bacterium]|nr:acetylornithine deacetylase [Verrucomicrobiaceae bacterium]
MTAKLPDMFGMLQALVGTPSVSCSSPNLDMSNRPVIDLLAQWLETLGFAVQIQPLISQPHKANLIATLGSGPGGLVLAGHTDTVPYNAEKWASDPFTLSERDNRWYGLGATDMKGFFPVAIEAAKAFLDQPLQQPLIILATADEETSMDGARELVAQGLPKARFAVIGEPTDLRPARLHKGMMMEAITINGQSGHSSDPSLGNNALEAMQEVMGDLLQFRAELQARYRNPAFDVQVPTLNLGCIHGGDNPNRICGDCELHFDLRPLPGMNIDELRHALTLRLQPLAEKRKISIHLRSLFPGIQAFEQPADSPLIRAVEQLTGYSANALSFATEAPFMRELGMDTVVFGPGSIRQAHQPDEYIDTKQLQPAVDAIKALIRKFCL